MVAREDVIRMDPHSIMGGIVTFEPDVARLAENIAAIRSQVDTLLVFDNHSGNFSQIEEVFLRYSCDVASNERNVGLGGGPNAIMLYAEGRGFSHACLLDQDSIASPNMIATLSKHFAEDVALVCPLIIDRNKTEREDSTHEFVHEVRRPITSGSVVSVAQWRAFDGFDSSLFIDYIDYEFDERCVQAGLRLVEDDSVSLLQEGGHAEASPLISGFIRTSQGLALKHPYRYNYSPSRLLVRYRNCVAFFRRYKGKAFRLSQLGHIAKNCLHDVVVEKKRFENLKAIASGMRAGARANAMHREGANAYDGTNVKQRFSL